jgi:hypothetical protein
MSFESNVADPTSTGDPLANGYQQFNVTHTHTLTRDYIKSESWSKRSREPLNVSSQKETSAINDVSRCR